MSVPLEPDRPQVELDWDLWCARHLEPYRARWPLGAPTAMVKLFQAAAAMPAVVDAAHGDAAQLTRALRRFAPLCCFVPAAVMRAIYSQTLPAPGAPEPPPPSASPPPSPPPPRSGPPAR